MSRVIVIGGGPAGMMAAGTAAENGAEVTLLEKNEKLGKKLYITGKGRCNVTNNTSIQGLLSNTISNPKFLQSAYNALNAQEFMAFIERLGTPLKTERGGRVFPVSDKAEDITKALALHMRKHKVNVALNCTVTNIQKLPGQLLFTVHTTGKSYQGDAVIIATGGLSYQSTGSTGDGYGFAKHFAHSIKPTNPSLVPLTVAQPWVKDLAGLSLRNVKLCIQPIKNEDVQNSTPEPKQTKHTNKAGWEQSPHLIGEMLFTPTGITGPIVLSASAYIAKHLDIGQQFLIEIDLKPALSHQQLDTRILRDFEESKNKDFANSLDGLLPKRLISTIIELSKIDPSKKVNTITKQERQNLCSLLKAMPLVATKTNGYREAVITQGGISVNEVNPSTMMSKKEPGLFFAGEVLDVDALTGGYNLQIAFSTGYLAGQYSAWLS